MTRSRCLTSLISTAMSIRACSGHLHRAAAGAAPQAALRDRLAGRIGGPLLPQAAGAGLRQDRARGQLAVPDVREEFVRLLRAVLGGELHEFVALEHGLRIE